MADYGYWTLLPPVVAIFLAIRTKQVYVSLIIGIWLGWLVLSGFNPLKGTFAAIQGIVDVFKSEGNTRTIIFSALVGGILVFIQRSGGVDGFIIKVTKFLEWLENRKKGNNRVVIQILAWLTGMFLFIETSINILTVGTLYRPVFDKLKIPRERLAYIADSSAAPWSVLIPFNGWGAFIMGLLVVQGIDSPFHVMLSVIPLNFYPILTLALVVFFAVTGKDFGPMRKAEIRTRTTGKLMNDNAKPLVSDEIASVERKTGVKPRMRNMAIPIITMVGLMPVMLAYTGWTNVTGVHSTFGYILQAIGQGSGSSAVLYSVIAALVVSMLLYRVQGIMRFGEMIELTLKGISGLMPLALLMVLAFGISDVCRNLGTGDFVAGVTKNWLSPGFVPFIIFSISCFIAFATGTSWGTFAIMMGIAVPMAQSLGVDIKFAIAATLGGGVFGDHCSPISDTTILASMASASDHIDHVKTQLPYALLAGGLTAVIYLIVGLLS